MDASQMFGVDLHFTDSTPSPPTAIRLDGDELYKWFHSFPAGDTAVHIRLLCVRLDSSTKPREGIEGFKAPLPSEVIEQAIWKSEVYSNLTNNPSGGVAGLVDDPWRFILQTPLDGGPFCSTAMSRHGIYVKGVYFYDNDLFHPLQLPGGDASLSSWRGHGLQIITVPHKFLQAHCIHISQSLANLVLRVRAVETQLASAEQLRLDLSNLSRTLHTCSADLIYLERRSRFEQSITNAIEPMVVKSKVGTAPWPPLAPQRATVDSRSFDFESLPHRIENARATISNLIQQRNEQINLELTQASFQIAEATLSDARSMKTIAVLTMVLLPATAVASLFSMGMLNWSAKDGGQLASKWIWIYFVVTVPLTAAILAVWWIWSRRNARELASPARTIGPTGTSRRFRDEELAHVQIDHQANIELQEIATKSGASE